MLAEDVVPGICIVNKDVISQAVYVLPFCICIWVVNRYIDWHIHLDAVVLKAGKA